MRDFLPVDVRKRNYVVGIIKEVYESYGFEPLETPAIENIETLMGKYGEEGNQLIYKLLKRRDKLNSITDPKDLADLALRYDLTVPLARVVANNKEKIPKFFKRYQIQPVWRADRPGRGRFREFYQCDVDAIGSSSMIVEAELIAAVSEVFQKLRFNSFAVRLNNRNVLTGILSASGVDSFQHTEALITLDKFDKLDDDALIKEFVGKGITGDAIQKIFDFFSQLTQLRLTYLNDSELSKIDAGHRTLDLIDQFIGNHPEGRKGTSDLRILLNFLRQTPASENVLIDPILARGLSYYTSTIMEVDAGFVGSLGGGGRYDGLIGMFGKEQIPACGFSIGLERILVVMEEREMFPPEIAESSPADVLVTIWSPNSAHRSLELACQLRSEGLRTLVYPNPEDKLAKQIKYADTLGIKKVALVGPEEEARNIVNIRDLSLSLQVEVSPPDQIQASGEIISPDQNLVLERDIFHEFAAMYPSGIALDSIKSEQYPKPDFSCLIDGEKSYFEVRVVRKSKNAGIRMREALSRAYFTPDGKANILFCLLYDSGAEVLEDYEKMLSISTFIEFPYWSSIHFYERPRRFVHTVVKW